jgi:uncharacterized protein YukE
VTNDKTSDEWSDDIHEALAGLRVAASEEASNHDREVVSDKLSELIANWQSQQSQQSQSTCTVWAHCARQLQEALRELYPEVSV